MTWLFTKQNCTVPKPLLSVFTKMACGSLILCSSIQPRRSLELLIPRFQLLLRPSTVGPFPPSLRPWSLLTAAVAIAAAPSIAMEPPPPPPPRPSVASSSRVCASLLWLLSRPEAHSCSHARTTVVAKEAAFIAAAGRKKKLGEHLLLQSWRRWTTVVCSVQAACKPAGRSRRRRVLPRAVVRGKGANGGGGGDGGDGGVAAVPSKLSRSWLFSRAYWAVQHMASRTSKSHRCLKAERESRALSFSAYSLSLPHLHSRTVLLLLLSHTFLQHYLEGEQNQRDQCLGYLNFLVDSLYLKCKCNAMQMFTGVYGVLVGFPCNIYGKGL